MSSFAVWRQLGKLSREKKIDPLWKDFPTCFRIEHSHNQNLYSAAFLRYRDVNDETIAKFKGLFSKGHSPSSALKIHKMYFQMEHGANYIVQSDDKIMFMKMPVEMMLLGTIPNSNCISKSSFHEKVYEQSLLEKTCPWK